MTSRLSTALETLASRRRALGLLGIGIGGLAAACNDTMAARAASGEGSCLATPTEIRGPFPADGTNGGRETVSVFGKEGLLRSDIRDSFAGMAGRADGIPLEIELRLVDARDGCAPLAGHALYLWQCDALGDYSLYNRRDANYLRGMQESDAGGVVRFNSILPGCYGGRCPHLHFEVFSSLAAATHGRNSRPVSQLAFPTAECERAYADTTRYGASLRNLGRWPMERDWMFAGNSPAEIAAQTVMLSGSPAAGYRGTATIGL